MNPTRELLIVAIQEVLREFQQEYLPTLSPKESPWVEMPMVSGAENGEHRSGAPR